MTRRLVLLSVVAAMLAAVGGPTSAAAPDRPAGFDAAGYDSYVLDHLDHGMRVRGERIMGGENLAPDGRFVSAAAAGPAPTPNVTQNGVCNDQKEPLEVGDTATFWVHNYTLSPAGADQDEERLFVLAAITDHVYMWVDAATYDPTNASGDSLGFTSQAEAQAGAESFESIYDIDREYFGEPARCDQPAYRQPPRMDEIWGGPFYDADDDPHRNQPGREPGREEAVR